MDAYNFFDHSQTPNVSNPPLFLPSSLEPSLNPLPTPQPPSIENLPLSDLLKNNEVLEIFNGWKEACKQVLKAQEYERELHNRNSQLEKEVMQLRGELHVLRTKTR